MNLYRHFLRTSSAAAILASTTVLAATPGCSTLSSDTDAAAQLRPQQATPTYPSILQESRVYRFCSGYECPAPKPAPRIVAKRASVSEIGLDGRSSPVSQDLALQPNTQHDATAATAAAPNSDAMARLAAHIENQRRNTAMANNINARIPGKTDTNAQQQAMAKLAAQLELQRRNTAAAIQNAQSKARTEAGAKQNAVQTVQDVQQNVNTLTEQNALRAAQVHTTSPSLSNPPPATAPLENPVTPAATMRLPSEPHAAINDQYTLRLG